MVGGQVEPCIEIVARSEVLATLQIRGLKDVAEEWQWLIRQRARLQGRFEHVMPQNGERSLEQLGVRSDVRSRLASESELKVRAIVSTTDFVDLPEVPWEQLLDNATARLRTGRKALTVVREWRNNERLPLGDGAGQLLVAVSAPGPLAGAFNFESEIELITGVRADELDQDGPGGLLYNPDAQELKDRCKGVYAVHLSGFDPLQARKHVAADKIQGTDGFAVSDRTNPDTIRVLEPKLLADVLGRKFLISCNLQYSAGRLARELLRGCAPYVIALQDDLDDAIAEAFFAEFYRHWRMDKDVEVAFRNAVRRTKAQRRGSAVVLWRHENTENCKALPQTQSTRQPTVDIKTYERMNCALLHNGISPFKTFRIFQPSGTDKRISVSVDLHDGSPGRSYKGSFTTQDAVTDLRGKIRVPLESRFLASASSTERQALLSVSVTMQGEELHNQTYPILIAPINEWHYGGHWTGAILPTYVLPADPVIAEVVQSALPALRAVEDNPECGFMGYDADTRYKQDEEFTPADDQVRALWHTIISTYAVNYITTPRAAFLGRQILRRPSDVTKQHHGTCIDLCLLLAAVLEYVGLAPVLVIYSHHTLVGYWTLERHHKDFANLGSNTSLRSNPGAAKAGQTHAWELPDQLHYEFRERVERHELRLIEATNLARQTKFRDAIVGLPELDKLEKHFRAMMDVVRARECGVNSLPLHTSR